MQPILQEQEPLKITLRYVFEQYKLTRNLKPVTEKNYTQRLNAYLKDWLDMPIQDITKDMVELRHRQIQGKAMANDTMRTLRALLEYASWKYSNPDDGMPIIKINPVKRLSEVRAWHRDKQRRDVIDESELRAWFQGVYSIESATFRDFLLVLLLTGMRKSEAMNLRWEQVNFQTTTINLKDTKNHEDVNIPMSDFVLSLMIVRKHGSRSEFVFPSRQTGQPISAGTKSINLVKMRSGVKFSLHTLRRTYATIGDELDIKHGVMKNLLNHKANDITEQYTCRSIERLRRATQQITDRILVLGGIRKAPIAKM